MASITKFFKKLSLSKLNQHQSKDVNNISNNEISELSQEKTISS